MNNQEKKIHKLNSKYWQKRDLCIFAILGRIRRKGEAYEK